MASWSSPVADAGLFDGDMSLMSVLPQVIFIVLLVVEDTSDSDLSNAFALPLIWFGVCTRVAADSDNSRRIDTGEEWPIFAGRREGVDGDPGSQYSC
jgi:hypothetical protein